MAACIWEKLKFHLGFWGAIAVIGLIMAGIAAIGVTTGGTGLVALVTAVAQTALGGAGLAVAGAGAGAFITTLVTGIILCWNR